MRHIAFPWTPFLFTPRLTAQCYFFIFSTSYKNYSTTAKISISTRTAFGRSLTATHERAGLLVKYFSYTPLNAPKSAISARKHVVFTTLSKLDPASSRTAAMLAITCSVCPSIVVASTSPVAGLIGIWPEAYNIPLTTFA